MSGRMRVTAIILVIAAVLGAYSFVIESLEDGGMYDTVNGTKLDMQSLIQENRELQESLTHLRNKYEDLMAYMKAQCYADDSERQKHMNSLCQTELDVCKGKLITERADKKRLSASMDRLDDKAIDMGKNLSKTSKDLSKVQHDKEVAFREADKLVGKLEKHKDNTALKEKKLSKVMTDSIQSEESKLSDILKKNGINLDPQKVDVLTSFDDDDDDQEAKKGFHLHHDDHDDEDDDDDDDHEDDLPDGKRGQEKSGPSGSIKVSIKHSGNATNDEIARVRALLPSILETLPKSEQNVAKQLDKDIKQHRKALKILQEDDDDDDEDLSPRDPQSHARMQGFKQKMKNKLHKRDDRPDIHQVLQDILPHLPASLVSSGPFRIFSNIPGAHLGAGNPFLHLPNFGSDQDSDDDLPERMLKNFGSRNSVNLHADADGPLVQEGHPMPAMPPLINLNAPGN